MADTNTNTTEAEVTKPIQGKLVVSISKPSPMWAIWLFRCVYGLSTIVALWLAQTNLVNANAKFEILLAVGCLDRLAWVIARGLGIKKTDFSDDSPNPQP